MLGAIVSDRSLTVNNFSAWTNPLYILIQQSQAGTMRGCFTCDLCRAS